MDLNNINPWAGGSALIVTGSSLLYFEGYKNILWLSGLASLFMFVGWIVFFINGIKNTAVDAPNIYFANDKIEWFKQNILRLLYYSVFLALGFGNFHYVSEFAGERKMNILQHEPTALTTAVVTGISEIRGRSSTSYYAIFEYKVNGKLIKHPWREVNRDDFMVLQRFIIKYSIAHSEMFIILKGAD